MAKRFTDTNKYKKSFIRGLPGAYKLLWDYLYHDCDHAGVWIVDMEIAQKYIGDDMPVSKKLALDLFNEDELRVIELDGGKKWFIPSFIEFQYGKLSEKNRAHLSVISILKKFDLLNDDLTIKIQIKPLTSPLQGAMDKDMDKDKEKDKEFGKSENLLDEPAPVVELSEAEKHSFKSQMLSVFKKHIPDYPESHEDDSPALRSIGKFIADQLGISYQPNAPDCRKRILETWEVMSAWTAKDSFHHSLSLKSIASSKQTIYQRSKKPHVNSKNNSNPGKTIEFDRA